MYLHAEQICKHDKFDDAGYTISVFPAVNRLDGYIAFFCQLRNRHAAFCPQVSDIFPKTSFPL